MTVKEAWRWIKLFSQSYPYHHWCHFLAFPGTIDTNKAIVFHLSPGKIGRCHSKTDRVLPETIVKKT